MSPRFVVILKGAHRGKRAKIIYELIDDVAVEIPGVKYLVYLPKTDIQY